MSQVITDTRGKHRILAGLKRLEQEARYLEMVLSPKELNVLLDVIRSVDEELEELEKLDKASAACKELLYNVEAKPDPLLSLTNGPLDPAWDRWFEGPQDSKGCRCWIL